jgi:hypothetical protein
LQVDSSKVSGIHKLYENTTEDSFWTVILQQKFTNTYSNSWRRDKKFQENPVFSC